MGNLRSVLPHEKTMELVIKKLQKDGDPQLQTVITAYELVKDIYAGITEYPLPVIEKNGTIGKETVNVPFLRFRVNMALVLAENVNARAEYIAASLLGPALKWRKLYESKIEKVIGEKPFATVNGLLLNVSSTDHERMSLVAEIDEIVFAAAIKELCENIRKKLRNRNSQLAYISNAYNMAAEAHKGIYRKSGEPYIIHPLMVASILTDIGLDSEVVAAAIVHDVVEDNDAYKLADIEKISFRVRKYVDAVTSVEREYVALRERAESLGEEFVAMDKDELGQETLNKLINYSVEDESMVFAICIKAADRLHNLRTIDGMKPEKIRSKLDETTDYYLPVFKKFGVNYFVDAIEDQIWRIACITNGHYQQVKESYEKLLRENKAALNDTKTMLNNVISQEFLMNTDFYNSAPYQAEINFEPLLPYEVYRNIRPNITDFAKLPQFVTKQNTSLARINILVNNNGNGSWSDFSCRFIRAFNKLAGKHEQTITDIVMEEIPGVEQAERLRFAIEDNLHNVVFVYIYMVDHYHIYRYGNNTGISLMQDKGMDAVDSMEENTIIVFGRDNTEHKLPAGSSVLDFAYRIHQELCKYATKASINGSSFTETNLTKTLYDGDRVIIEQDKDARAEGANTTAQIDWLLYVRSVTAKKNIVKWLKHRYKAIS